MLRKLITKMTPKMAQRKKETTASGVRNTLSDDLQKNTVTPITHYGKFCGVIITCGELEDWEKNRLEDIVSRNPRAAINEILDKIGE